MMEYEVMVKLQTDDSILAKESKRTQRWVKEYCILNLTVELEKNLPRQKKMYDEMFRLRTLILKYSKYAKQNLKKVI